MNEMVNTLSRCVRECNRYLAEAKDEFTRGAGVTDADTAHMSGAKGFVDLIQKIMPNQFGPLMNQKQLQN